MPSSYSWLIGTIPASYSSTDGAKIQDFSGLENKLEEILRVLADEDKARMQQLTRR
jgi:hypothetical protein